MLVISSHAPSIVTQIEVHAPQASLHSTRWMEVHFRDLRKIRLGFYEILIKDSIWKGGVVSFFNEVDIGKELSS